MNLTTIKLNESLNINVFKDRELNKPIDIHFGDDIARGIISLNRMDIRKMVAVLEQYLMEDTNNG